MKKFSSNKQAFTLVEVIVAFSVLVLVIVASTNLLVSVIRSNTENENTLVAYGLAQEGLEAVRNMRDSDWLLGADFEGYVGTSCVWEGGCFPQQIDTSADYVLDFRQIDSQGADITHASDLQSVSPWMFYPVDLSDPNGLDWQKTKLYIPKAPDQGQNQVPVWYKPCVNGCDNTVTQSPFSRYIEVVPAGYQAGDTDIKKYRVTSVVRWQEIGRPKEVRLTTELTDWKGGPL